MNPILTLALSAIAASGTTTPAPSDPLLVGLTSQLASNDQAKNPEIASLYAITGDPSKPKALGAFEFAWTNPKSNLRYRLSVTRLDSFAPSGTGYYFKGAGVIRNGNFSSEVQVEWTAQDNKKQGAPADAPGDSFALHFWRPNSDLNFSWSWRGNSFTAVEIYRPTL